jgi:hypothetical protein
MGIKEYCKDLFKETKFYFWEDNELNKNCEQIESSLKFI